MVTDPTDVVREIETAESAYELRDIALGLNEEMETAMSHQIALEQENARLKAETAPDLPGTNLQEVLSVMSATTRTDPITQAIEKAEWEKHLDDHHGVVHSVPEPDCGWCVWTTEMNRLVRKALDEVRNQAHSRANEAQVLLSTMETERDEARSTLFELQTFVADISNRFELRAKKIAAAAEARAKGKS